MMHHDRGSALLRLEQESGSQPHSDVFFRLEQGEELGLILQIGARRISEGIPRPAIFLMEQIANFRRIVACDGDLLFAETGFNFGSGVNAILASLASSSTRLLR